MDKFERPAPHRGEKILRLTLLRPQPGAFDADFETVPPTDPDAPAMMLLQAVLSGQSGLLFRICGTSRPWLYGNGLQPLNAQNRLHGLLRKRRNDARQIEKSPGTALQKLSRRSGAKPLAEDLLKAGANRLLRRPAARTAEPYARAQAKLRLVTGILHYPRPTSGKALLM